MNWEYQKNQLSDDDCFMQTEAGNSLRETPLGFIDIGARGGTHELVNAVAKYTNVVCFEADRDECQRLQKMPEISEPWNSITIIPKALFNSSGTCNLHLLSANTNHSLYPPNTGFTKRYNMNKWIEIGQTPLNTDTLDHTLSSDEISHDGPFGELIKLDTQGTEYEILQGAKEVLTKDTVAILTEVSFSELYQGQKLFSEVEILLRDYGFTFYGFVGGRIHHRSCKLLDKKIHATAERAMFANTVFLKDPLSGSAYRGELNQRQQYSLFTCALLFGYFDFALELAYSTWASNNESERRHIETLVHSLSHYDPHNSLKVFRNAVESMNTDPDSSNLIAGKLTDSRRYLNDFDDVFNVSTLPEMK